VSTVLAAEYWGSATDNLGRIYVAHAGALGASMIVKFLLWLLRKLGRDMIPIPMDIGPILIQARQVCAELENVTVPGAGEFKRGKAFKTLVRRNPGIKRHSIGLAIELAVGEMQ